MNRGPTWIDTDHWLCSNHMRSVRLPAAVSRCYYATCQTPRPERKIRTARRVSTLTGPNTREALSHNPSARALAQTRPAITPSASTPAFPKSGAGAETEAMPPITTQHRPPARPMSVSALLDSTLRVLEQPKSEDTRKTGQCAWEGCSSAVKPRSKYCSRDCSNKNARARYKSRRVLH